VNTYNRIEKDELFVDERRDSVKMLEGKYSKDMAGLAVASLGSRTSSSTKSVRNNTKLSKQQQCLPIPSSHYQLPYGDW
jgi:hypothetical protein